MIDPLTNYPNFRQDILDTFELLIKNDKFIFQQIYDGCYELKNSNCALRFTYDKGDVACAIKRPKSETIYGYGVSAVLEYLYPSLKFSVKLNDYDPKRQLLKYSEILRIQLKNVLEGDFSWEKGFLQKNEEIQRMIAFIWNEIDKEDPIYLKFKMGDLSWQMDLRYFLHKKGIVL